MEIVIGAVIAIWLLAIVGRVVFGFLHAFWFGRTVYRLYNAAVEEQLRQLALAMQAQQQQQAWMIQQAIQQRLHTLPKREQKFYEHKLSDVVERKQKLNSNGEWVDA